ncbi:MAG: hypothetical protein PWQ09_614 [Candidatus Cloacimonadota bacterium]|jgi:hypothetical protein|nr:hypothetical protein [Candidatus Cloacimonadota bacterium]
MIFFASALVSQSISEKEDLENKVYLSALDKNVLNTVELLDAFKTGMKKMQEKEYDKVEYYKSFLEDVSNECFLIRDNIFNSVNMQPEQRSEVVKDVIKSLKPDVIYENKYIPAQQDRENSDYLDRISVKLMKKVNETLQNITKEEENIKKNEAISREYLKLHSQHFMYSMLLNYITPSEHLNKRNRNFLVKVAKEIMVGMQEA